MNEQNKVKDNFKGACNFPSISHSTFTSIYNFSSYLKCHSAIFSYIDSSMYSNVFACRCGWLDGVFNPFLRTNESVFYTNLINQTLTYLNGYSLSFLPPITQSLFAKFEPYLAHFTV